MTVYLIIIALLVLLSVIYDFKKPYVNSNRWYAVVTILLVVLAGIRGDVGNDTTAYHLWYNTLPANLVAAINSTRFEPLFSVVCAFCKQLGFSWIVPQFLFAFLINFSVLKTISRLTSYKFLGALLYFLMAYYFLNFEELRQAVGFSFILLGLQYVNDKRYWLRYSFIVLIASCFHYSSILFIIVPFLPNVFKKKFYVVVVLIASFAAATYLRSNFSEYALAIDSFLSIDTMSSYTEGLYTEAVNRTIMNYVNIFIFSLLIPLITYYISYENNTDLRKWFFLLLLFQVASVVLTIFYRYNHLMAVIDIIVLCRAFAASSKTKNIVIRIFVWVVLLTSIYSTYNTYTNPSTFLDGSALYENFVPYGVYEDY